MPAFTMELNEVMATLYSPTTDNINYEPEYREFSFNGNSYGKLPVLPDPVKMGLGTYPIFDEEYRPILNGKIVDEYFLQEIGFETIEVWKHAMRRTMDQVMPYFNQLYKSELIKFDPLSTIDINTVRKDVSEASENATNSTEAGATSHGESQVVNSTTPQTMLARNEDYATSGTRSENNANSSNTGSGTSTSERDSEVNIDSRTNGFQGPASALMMRYRESFLNIDVAVIESLRSCFMLLRNSGSSYTNSAINPYWGY